MPTGSASTSAAAAAASALLARCRSLAAVKQLHAHFLTHSNGPFPYNHFLSKLLSLSSATVAVTNAASDYALLLLSSHPAPTAFSYNVTLRFFASSRPGTTLGLFLRMLRAGLRPDAYTLPFLLLAAARSPSPPLARSAHAAARPPRRPRARPPPARLPHTRRALPATRLAALSRLPRRGGARHSDRRYILKFNFSNNSW